MLHVGTSARGGDKFGAAGFNFLASLDVIMITMIVMITKIIKVTKMINIVIIMMIMMIMMIMIIIIIMIIIMIIVAPGPRESTRPVRRGAAHTGSHPW